MSNLITDVPGLKVGNAHDARAATGVTVAVFDRSCVAGVATLGAAPGDRAETLLEPEMTRGFIDAVVLSGGSLYCLDAAGGVSAVLCARGKGAALGGIVLPLVVQAILFDLMNGGDTVFAVSTGYAGAGGEPPILTELGTAAADCLARTVARGVHEAAALPYATSLPDYRQRFGA